MGLSDLDGDGYSNEEELIEGGSPLWASSTPDTDDDGDGKPNRYVVEFDPTQPHRLLLHNSLVASGSHGITMVKGYHSTPSGETRRWWERWDVTEEGIYYWDPIDANALLGQYGTKNEDGEIIMDGPGWDKAFDMTTAAQFIPWSRMGRFLVAKRAMGLLQ